MTTTTTTTTTVTTIVTDKNTEARKVKVGSLRKLLKQKDAQLRDALEETQAWMRLARRLENALRPSTIQSIETREKEAEEFLRRGKEDLAYEEDRIARKLRDLQRMDDRKSPNVQSLLREARLRHIIKQLIPTDFCPPSGNTLVNLPVSCEVVRTAQEYLSE